MEALFDGIALGEITTSMTINAPAPMIFAMYLAVAKRRGIDWQRLSGTIQNDILKEFIAQKEYIYPPRPSMRLVTDVFAFCASQVPRWNTISVSGYHIREAGATAVQELAFTLRDGVEYVQAGVDAGLEVDRFVPRMSFFFNAHSDFFEEIAKYRAARRIWARVMRERFGATDERSLKLRFHAQTAGVSLTAQQPMNNVMRTALQALSAVLGGTNSLHTNSLDEALALPTAEAATLALRTQQVLAYETGVVESVDPFGGSYFVERLTRDLEEETTRVSFGPSTRWAGWWRRSSADIRSAKSPTAPIAFSRTSRPERQVIVGVNEFVSGRSAPCRSCRSMKSAAGSRSTSSIAFGARANAAATSRALERLRETAAGDGNTMPALLDGRPRRRDDRRDVRRAARRLGRIPGAGDNLRSE